MRAAKDQARPRSSGYYAVGTLKPLYATVGYFGFKSHFCLLFGAWQKVRRLRGETRDLDL